MHARIIGPLALGASLAMTATHLFAAGTLKFAFTSEISSTSQPWVGSAMVPEPPFAVHVGDVLRGTVEFDPSVATPGTTSALQPFAFTVNVLGTTLSILSYTSYAFDDRRNDGTICDCGWTGPVSPDPLIFLGDHFASSTLPAIDDRIELYPFIGIAPGSDSLVPGAGDWIWQPAITLTGATSILSVDGPLPTDPAVWNSFAVKEFRIGIVGPRFGDVPGYGVQKIGTETFSAAGSILSFVLVPEPQSLILLTMAAAAVWRRNPARRTASSGNSR